MPDTLEHVLQKAFRAQLGDVEITLPGVVESFDPSSASIKARPAVGDLPAIYGVPVLYPSGGGFTLTYPLTAGDKVWLLFSGRSFRGWLEGGADPKHRFMIGDCAALPASPNNPSINPSTLELGTPNGVKLTLSDQGKITLGTAQADILLIMMDLIESLQLAVVATATGPQPLDPATQATLAQLKILLGTLC